MKDWPRIAKLQSDLLAQALVTRQTRVASYMLTKGQGLARFPWLGLTAARHHDYTHADGKAPGGDSVDGQRILRDITKWHAEEFAYLLAQAEDRFRKATATVLDHTCLLYAHEHAEANPHKCSGLAMIVAGHMPALEDRRAHARHGHHRRPLPDGGRRNHGSEPRQVPDRIQEDDRDSGVEATAKRS